MPNVIHGVRMVLSILATTILKISGPSNNVTDFAVLLYNAVDRLLVRITMFKSSSQIFTKFRIRKFITQTQYEFMSLVSPWSFCKTVAILYNRGHFVCIYIYIYIVFFAS